MKILFISTFFPYENVSHAGGKTVYYYVNSFARDDEVTLLTFVTKQDFDKLEQIHSYRLVPAKYGYTVRDKAMRFAMSKVTKYWPFQKYCGFYNSYDEFLLKKKLSELVREKYNPDIIILEWTQCVLTRDLVHSYFPNSKIVASEHDFSVVGFQRKVEAGEKHFTPKRLENLKRLELGALARCDMTVFHSREDLKRASNMMPQCKEKFSSIVPYYDDYGTVEWNPTTKNIVFFGALNRMENVKSAIWFYDNVFCKLKDKSWKLILLGSHPDKQLIYLSVQDKRVVVTGFVEDIKPWLQNCACMIAPLIMGAGIKVKVLEALSAGVPLLTNEIGMEGIDAQNEKEYFHCQVAEDYVQVLDSFFDNIGKLLAMSAAEKQFVKKYFNKKTSYEKYRNLLLKMIGETVEQ